LLLNHLITTPDMRSVRARSKGIALGTNTNKQQRRRRAIANSGMAMVYLAMAMFALCALATLAVDFARVQTSKQELELATDAAARYAATGLLSVNLGVSGASANAAAEMAENMVDGAPAPFNPNTDIATGIWSSSTQTFTPATVAAGANAVKLTTTFTMGVTGHPLSFLSLFVKSFSVHSTSIAVVTGKTTSTYVSAAGNPWLAGMPAGTVCTDFRTSPSEQDTAGSGANIDDSPAAVSLSSMGISSGMSMNFDDVTGSANYGGGNSGSADGDTTLLCTLGSSVFGDTTYFNSSMNGMSNVYAPVDSMVAVFLTDASPAGATAPPPLDFSTDADRNFTSLAPQLNQVFFVGDGRCDDGEVQQFVVPTGATRLFIANMDGWQYNNNVGGYNLSVHATQSVSTVMTQ
jgi:Flp pilus assembly protein TadG